MNWLDTLGMFLITGMFAGAVLAVVGLGLELYKETYGALPGWFKSIFEPQDGNHWREK
ncbi:hypothetical protein QP248_02775 [Aerococcus sp. UMB8608]|uniref:hypothetical protein n=1 Tax=Aerococcus TaxID=1375 RepID=UPI000AD5CB8C|nr:MULTISPECIES: hypothetical protein [Aerococcus]MDK6679374.1 hypothetical protein [Aerococcus sp. UMB8608]MDK6685784.1 hypothetical protein [Aerococcus sp. UMB8623]